MNTSVFRLVIDTNVALDLWLFDRPGLEHLADLLARHRPLGTRSMRDELATVLARSISGRGSIHRRWLSESRVASTLSAWDHHVELVDEPLESRFDAMTWPRCTDADDQKFVDLALSCSAEWLLTRDRQLLRLQRACAGRGVRVATPETLVATLSGR